MAALCKLKSNDKRHFDTQCKKSLRKEGGWVKDGSLKAKTGGQKAQLMTSKDTKDKSSHLQFQYLLRGQNLLRGMY